MVLAGRRGTAGLVPGPAQPPASTRLPLWSFKELSSHCPQLSPLNLGVQGRGDTEYRLGPGQEVGDSPEQGTGQQGSFPPPSPPPITSAPTQPRPCLPAFRPKERLQGGRSKSTRRLLLPARPTGLVELSSSKNNPREHWARPAVSSSGLSALAASAPA